MNDNRVTITIDGQEVQAEKEQTILQAALAAGVYIPHLCYHKDLIPGGHCRICTVVVNGKANNSCTMIVAEGMVIDNNTEELNEERRHIIEMLFVEGNHICPFCEASGNCELQALAYRLGMDSPRYPYLFPKKEIDGSHPDVYLDRNRCILCGRCIRSSRQIDGKNVFGFEKRGIQKRIAVDSDKDLAHTALEKKDRAPEYCPTGALVYKHIGYQKPFGSRKYDKEPIGLDIEGRKK